MGRGEGNIVSVTLVFRSIAATATVVFPLTLLCFLGNKGQPESCGCWLLEGRTYYKKQVDLSTTAGEP